MFRFDDLLIIAQHNPFVNTFFNIFSKKMCFSSKQCFFIKFVIGSAETAVDLELFGLAFGNLFLEQSQQVVLAECDQCLGGALTAAIATVSNV